MNRGLKLDLEYLFDALAERVAEKLKSTAQGGTASQSAPARLLTVEQAAAYLSRTKASVQHMISAGRLPTVRADRRVFLDVRDLDVWIEQNKERGSV